MASAVYEGEVAFISGVAENGTVVGNSFWTMHHTRRTACPPCRRRRSGAVERRARAPTSPIPSPRPPTGRPARKRPGKAASPCGRPWPISSSLEAADAASANFVITRGNDRAAFARYSAPGPERGRRQHPRPSQHPPAPSSRSTPTPWPSGPSARTSRRAVAIRCQRSCTRSATSSALVTAACTTATSTRWCPSSAPTTPSCGR